ncbi:MAG: choice-of-anchor J domain-containing protein [Bacteroidetes bacterium]|nr:choice-of-anchor J domain-containing protein [Bacteroidota bacterium]
MKKLFLFLLLTAFCIDYSFGQSDLSGPLVQKPVYFDISPPLSEMVKNLPPEADNSWKDGVIRNKFNVVPRPKGQAPGGLTDPFLQTMNGMTVTDTTIVNFEGNSNTQGYTPPDTHGDVGPNHYFQVVNCHYSIYSKTGALLFGPLANSSVFTGMPNNTNSGDAVVLYDEQADRWVFSQFSLPNSTGPFYQMIAVSATSNPTGVWYRYQYSFTNMPDYPKFGVWGDGYYMSMHMFTSTAGGYAGIGAVAYNRSLMLAGSAAPDMIMFTKSSSSEGYGWLPSDCDGSFPAGNPPNYFLYNYDGTSNDHLGMYEFHVDWTTTTNSTFTNFLSLPVNAFTTNISGISQQGTAIKLDVLNDRMMYRLQYRSFAGYSTLVCNHTVDISSTVAGIRWYELRKSTGAWSIYQQGTYSPADNNSRWMGSIAMDSSGNIALGYSVSGSSLFPSIRYCGRKKNDALNQMTIAERGIMNGGGSQTDAGSRWGDYSALSCDPSAKATFWYTQMYYSATSAISWKTRIASFRFAIPPGVTTLAATAISGTNATLNGSVNPNGVATTYNFEWGPSVSYGNTTATTSAGSGNSAVAVSAGLTGLTGGTTHHFRIVATSANGTSYGDDLSFTPGVAVVATTAVSSITMSTAVSGGTVTTDGGLPVTARGVCWGTTANPLVSGNHTTDGSGIGSFVSSITGLSTNSLYHVRAYATNSSGTYYGSDLTFSTPCLIIAAFPWNEGFESGGSIPSCWTQEQVNFSNLNWVFISGNGISNPATAHGGSYNACLKDATTADNKTRLITPMLNLSSVVSPQLKFWHTQAVSSGNQDQLEVYYRTSLAGTWTLLNTYTASTSSWTQRTISLPNGSGEYYIAFQGNAKNGKGICIDDVQVSSSCATTYPVSISIAASANPVIDGTVVTFTTNIVNGGASPAYQWKVNGANVAGASNATYSYVPVNNDSVACVLISNATCATGNPATSAGIKMVVNPSVPATTTLQNITVADTGCINATLTITVAGGGNYYIVQTGGSATMLAGENILFYPGTVIAEGGYLYGNIIPGGPWCVAPAMASVMTGTVESRQETEHQFYRIFPNPTKGALVLELNPPGVAGKYLVEIYDMKGIKLLSDEFSDRQKYQFSLTGHPAGIYMIRVIGEKNAGTTRVVKN